MNLIGPYCSLFIILRLIPINGPLISNNRAISSPFFVSPRFVRRVFLLNLLTSFTRVTVEPRSLFFRFSPLPTCHLYRVIQRSAAFPAVRALKDGEYSTRRSSGGEERETMIDTYLDTLATVLGSMEEAKKNMYSFSTTTYTGIQCTVSEETSEKFKGLPGVLWVLPDSYIDVKNKDYGGDKYINGEIIPLINQSSLEPQNTRAKPM